MSDLKREEEALDFKSTLENDDSNKKELNQY